MREEIVNWSCGRRAFKEGAPHGIAPPAAERRNALCLLLPADRSDGTSTVALKRGIWGNWRRKTATRGRWFINASTAGISFS
jgi:hypothetical protein